MSAIQLRVLDLEIGHKLLPDYNEETRLEGKPVPIKDIRFAGPRSTQVIINDYYRAELIGNLWVKS